MRDEGKAPDDQKQLVYFYFFRICTDIPAFANLQKTRCVLIEDRCVLIEDRCVLIEDPLRVNRRPLLQLAFRNLSNVQVHGKYHNK
jgi:hypothetical protein